MKRTASAVAEKELKGSLAAHPQAKQEAARIMRTLYALREGYAQLSHRADHDREGGFGDRL